MDSANYSRNYNDRLATAIDNDPIPTTAASTCEAEYMALSLAVKELIWIYMMLKTMGINVHKPCIVYEDKRAALKIVNNDRHPSSFTYRKWSHQARPSIYQKTVDRYYDQSVWAWTICSLQEHCHQWYGLVWNRQTHIHTLRHSVQVTKQDESTFTVLHRTTTENTEL